MPQAATITSLPVAFEMSKAMEADARAGGEDDRPAARQALTDLLELEGRMDETVDRRLERMAERGRADRRNGCYRCWLLNELGAIELAVHADCPGAAGGPRVRPPGARRRSGDPGLLRARPVDRNMARALLPARRSGTTTDATTSFADAPTGATVLPPARPTGDLEDADSPRPAFPCQ